MVVVPPYPKIEFPISGCSAGQGWAGLGVRALDSRLSISGAGVVINDVYVDVR